MAYSFTAVVIVCIRQGRGRPHYTKYTDIDDNAVIAVKKAEMARADNHSCQGPAKNADSAAWS